MPFVRYVASNVKGGVSCELGEKTLIVGGNGTGKSSVIQSIELAVGGFASDISGREELSKESELAALAPGRKGELWARAVLSDGTEAKWSAGGKDGKKSNHRFPESIDPKLAFPLRDVRSAVRGAPATARKFFIGYALPGLTLDDVLSRIPQELHQHFRTATLSCDISAAAVDKLLEALDYAGKRARESKAKVRGQQEVVGAVAGGLAPLPTEEIVTAVKKAAKDAKQALELLIQQESEARQLQRTQAESSNIGAQLLQAQQNVAQLGQALAQADMVLQQNPPPAALDALTQQLMSFIERLAQLEAQSGGAPVSCPVCKHVPPPGTFTQRHAAACEFRAREEAKAGPYQQALQARQAVAQNLAGWQNHVNQLQVQQEAVRRATATGAVTPPTPEQIAEARARVEAADGEITRIETLKAQWASAAKAKDAAKDSQDESNHWAKLKDACTEAVASLLDAGVTKFVARVQAALPPNDHFDMVLRDGQKQVFHVGFKRDGTIHTALSGAEWARMMAAISGACLPPPGKLALVIPEERAFDAQTLTNVLHAFNSLSAQVIIASPVMPAFVPQGWTVIDTATGTHRLGASTETKPGLGAAPATFMQETKVTEFN